MASDGVVLSPAFALELRRLVAAEVSRRLNTANRARDGSIDHEEFLAPEVYIAFSPWTGIPAMKPPHAGTGSSLHYRPGVAECPIYRIVEDASGVAELEAVDGLTRRVYNLAIGWSMPGLQPFTPLRDKFGSWLVPWPGLEFIECDLEPGSGTGTGTHVNPSGCFTGNCGDAGVTGTLAATVTSKVGCLTAVPDTFTLACVNNGDPPNGFHHYVPTDATMACGSALTNWTLLGFGVGAALTPGLGVIIDGAGVTTMADAGWTCSPFGAVFHVNDGSGNSMTVTVVG